MKHIRYTRSAISKFLTYILLWSLLFIRPIFSFGYDRYFTLIFPLIGVASFVLLERKSLLITKEKRLFLLFIFYHLVLLVYHRNDVESLFNLTALLVSYLSLYFYVIYNQEILGWQVFENVIFKSVFLIVGLSIPASIIMTSLGWQNAPAYFPWETIYTEQRMLLFGNSDIGHSDVLWLVTFLALYRLRNNFAKGASIFSSMFIIILGSIYLLLTKSRTGLLFALLICTYPLAVYIKRIKYLILASAILFVGIVYLASFSTLISQSITDVLYVTQERLPEVRILGSGQEKLAVFTGRDILNKSLIDFVGDHWIFGLGDGHPIFALGVNWEGEIALLSSQRVASCESILAIYAKYGIIYCLLFAIWVAHAAYVILKKRILHSDLTFEIYIIVVIFLSFITGGIFLNLYGLSGLFALYILLYQYRSSMTK
jgi:hypothetical protein